MKKIRVRQVRSAAARTGKLKATLSALGLGKIGKSREVVATPAIVGMIRTVAHLVEVEAA